MNFRQTEDTQPETIKIVRPFVAYMESQGWRGYNIHGNKFQKGIPDYYFFNSHGRHLWVEFKVCHAPNGRVEITDAQKVRFAEMFHHKLPVYVVGDYDLRGNTAALEVHYRRVTRGEPNLDLVLHDKLHKHIPSGMCQLSQRK